MTLMICAIAIVLAVVAVDQVSKVLIVAYLYEGQWPLIPQVLHFTYVENRGMAFGMLENHRWVFLLLSAVGILLASFYLFRYVRRRLSVVGLSLIIGGGIGNMIDRIFRGFVVDFIDFCAFPSLWSWVFNVADAAVCVGAALFMLDLILELIAEIKRERAAAGGESDHADGP